MIEKNFKPFLQATTDIREICRPLKNLGIHLFSYRRCFSDGSRINFSNNADWLRDYYLLNLYQSSLFEQPIHLYSTGFSLWPQESSLPIFSHGRQYYNSDNGITLAIQHQEYCDFFIFGASAQNKKIINFYINNLELLKNFSDFFYEKSKKIIETNIKHCIHIPHHSLLSDFAQHVYSDSKAKIDKFQINLSNREKECLAGILLGQSAKQIARNLNLSFRTIEYYIEGLKRKTKCRTRFDFFKKFS